MIVKILSFILFIFLVACDEGPNITVTPETTYVAPGQRVGIIVDVSNLNDNERVISYRWSILSSGCGSLSNITGRYTYWTAPIVSEKKNCIIEVEVFIYNGHSTYSDYIQYEMLVDPDLNAYNLPPYIIEFQAEKDTAYTDETIYFLVYASDPEGGYLRYRWTATCGRIGGSGSGASWTAPSYATNCSISVSIQDDHGAAVGDSIMIEVISY